MAIERQSPRARGDASCDDRVVINVYVAPKGHHVAPHFALERNVPRIAANASLHLAGHPDLPRRRKHVSHNMARYFHVSAGNHQIAFDRAGDADLPACDVQVAVNDLVLHDRDAVALAEFRGGSRRRREQRRAQTRKYQGERRPAADPPPQEHHAQAAQRRYRQNLENCDHGLPSFPERTLENQQAQQIRSAKAGLLQLGLPGFDVLRIERIHAGCRQSKCQSPDPLHGALRGLLELRQPRRQRFVVFEHRPGQQPRFALERTQQRAAVLALLRVQGNFQPARAVQLPLEVQQAGHLIQMLHLFFGFAHEAPPAATAVLPSSACRSSCRARSNTTPTKARRTPSASAISS